MNPVVLIATHNRLEITSKNIDLLLKQSVKPKILIVCSSENERDVLFHAYGIKDEITVVTHPNNPLGAKWQRGIQHMVRESVHFSLDWSPDPLIITGSDDILGSGFIERACKLVEEGNHFIGLQRFWQHNKGKAYLCDYLAHQPIGGGRVYSGEMLKAINYQVFDTTKDKHLDDLGWNKARTSGLKVKWVRNTETEGLQIHAIKGDWPTLNPFTIHHRNLGLLRSEPGIKVLPEYYG